VTTESHFTKGPWHIAPSNAPARTEGASIIDGQNGFGIRAAPGVYVEEDDAADLALMAASPELASALQLVASKTVLTSGIRAVVDAALEKAGVRTIVPEPVRHIRIVGENA